MPHPEVGPWGEVLVPVLEADENPGHDAGPGEVWRNTALNKLGLECDVHIYPVHSTQF